MNLNWLSWQEGQINRCLDALGYGEGDWLALGALGSNETLQRFVRREDIRHFLPWLRQRNAAKSNIYFTPCHMLQLPAGRKKEYFEERQRAIYLDLDSKKEPSSVMFRRLFDAVPSRPSMIIRSSRGNYQVYYILKEPEPWQVLERTSRSLCRLLGIDHAHDVSRFMRLPGFRNYKPGRNGDLVYIVDKMPVSGTPVQNALFREFAGEVPAETDAGSSARQHHRSNDLSTACAGLTRWHEYFSGQIGRKYVSQSEADVATVHYALGQGLSADVISGFLDAARPGKSLGYGARTVKSALAYQSGRTRKDPLDC